MLQVPGSSFPAHVLSIEGETGTGKTYLATQAPGRIGIFSTDHRYADVIRRFPDYKERFLVGDYVPQVDLSADQLFKDARGMRNDSVEKILAEKASQRESEKVDQEAWQPFVKDYRQLLNDDSFRTLILDQADEFNELLRLVNFGKLEQNPQMHYGPVNQEYKGLIKQARVKRKILILIHQMSDEYKTVQDESGKDKSVSTGRRRRRWNKHAGYLIDSFVRTEGKNAEGEYITRIVQAKLNPAMDGLPLVNPTWEDLMAALAPDVPAEAWR